MSSRVLNCCILIGLAFPVLVQNDMFYTCKGDAHGMCASFAIQCHEAVFNWL